MSVACFVAAALALVLADAFTRGRCAVHEEACATERGHGRRNRWIMEDHPMDDQEQEAMLALAKKYGATTRAGRISFPNVQELAQFSDAWVQGAPARRWEHAVAAVESPGDVPLPAADGYWGHDWPHRVEAYARHHGVPRAEVFRRVADATGAHIQSMSLRFQKAKP